MTTWIRKSGSEIELQDTDNHKAYAKDNGWVEKVSAPEFEAGDSVIIAMKEGDDVAGVVVKALKTKIVLTVGDDDVDIPMKDISEINKSED